MLFVIFLFVLIAIIIIISNYYVLLNAHYQINTDRPLTKFDNSNVPQIQPPSEIIIESNPQACHKQLTPCTTHMDCDVCREGLANCQRFDEPTEIVMRDENGDETKHTINPGQSYCLALDRNRARSCNPNTGVWILAESAVGFSLLCNCIKPGLVTQLNLYGDCNIPVGCQPNGTIANLNESPLRCVCDAGFVSDFDETQTPICRPQKLRDFVDDERYFPRHPCDKGFVRIDHPALDPAYREQLRDPTICVIDPCSIDPITNRRTQGTLIHYKESEQVFYNFCQCPVSDNLFPVHSDDQTMIAPSSAKVCNACVQPFSVNPSTLNIQYKIFWARANLNLSDDEIVAHVHPHQMSHDRYRNLLHTNTNSSDGRMTFKLALSYTVNLPNVPFPNMYNRYLNIASSTSEPNCFKPGVGRCITVNPYTCIRRHNSAAVGSAEFFTGQWCLFSRDGSFIKMWSPISRYPVSVAPVMILANGRFAWNSTLRENTELTVITIDKITKDNERFKLKALLETYSNYSV
ncbi:PIF-1 [Urbanus proteus nucleopolyhedrovirus]|uniref:PIF-1 n=1 Tax=Urbanus proteus nucleopolyhedrovirus TaxID=1675866 RepID=A0A162GU65_9ABAC|nr:PIF-1 [Urbanus proteus nucleopolyhedrovirus]AKR17326.1 PIF-1 [Urbanus proteus nucleopolyhedrovirus]